MATANRVVDGSDQSMEEVGSSTGADMDGDNAQSISSSSDVRLHHRAVISIPEVYVFMQLICPHL
jgi:hypothetical protein